MIKSLDQLLELVDGSDGAISEVARSHQIDRLSLRLQLLLHLPRIIDRIPSPNAPALISESIRLAQVVCRRQSPYRGWSDAPSRPLVSPRELIFDAASEAEARVIHERFHFVGSFRPESLHFCLRTKGDLRLAALATLSPMDLVHVERLLPDGLRGRETRVLSRVFAFDWVGPNTLTFLFGRLFRAIEESHRDVQLIVSYVNHNMGFWGASYRASNWILLGWEHGTRYCYVDEAYRTDRSLALDYGTAEEARLHALLGPRFETSHVDLQPLAIYTYFLDRKLRGAFSKDLNLSFQRPML